MFDFTDRFGDFAKLAMYRARRPVRAPNFVDHRAADADAGEGFETGAHFRIEVACRLEQPDHAGLDQVVDLHRRRQAIEQVVSDALDQRSMPNDRIGIVPELLYLGIHRVPVHR